MTLTDFLLARIAEDEEVALAMGAASDPLDWSDTATDDPAVGLAGPCDGPSGYESLVIDPARVLAECEAKGMLVNLATADGGASTDAGYVLDQVLRTIALPYADHPDYREEWRP